jgi:hypothetical protein
LLQFDLSVGCALLDILRVSHHRAQRLSIDCLALLLINRVADARRGLSIFSRCDVAGSHRSVRQLPSNVASRSIDLRGEEHARGGPNECATDKTRSKAAPVTGGGLESWLGSIFMFRFVHVICCTVPK